MKIFYCCSRNHTRKNWIAQ